MASPAYFFPFGTYESMVGCLLTLFCIERHGSQSCALVDRARCEPWMCRVDHGLEQLRVFPSTGVKAFETRPLYDLACVCAHAS